MKSRTVSNLGGILLAAAATAAAPEASAKSAPAGSGSYRVSASLPFGGEGRWDLLAVDADTNHVFLSRSDRVDVVDAGSGKLVGSISGTDGVHGIEIVPALHRGYSTNGHSNSLTEFDLVTLKRLRDIALTGESPDAIVYDPTSGRLLVFNAKSNNASVVDPVKGEEIGTLSFEGNPELGVADGHGRVFVNIEDKAQLVEIDTTTMKIMQAWPLPGCEGPTGLAMDIAHARLFSVCDNQVMVVTDAGDGHQVAKIAIGEGPDGAAFDPKSQDIFSPNGRSGTLSVIHEDDAGHFRIVQTLVTQMGARTIALNPATHQLFLPTAQFGPRPEGSNARAPMVPGSFSLTVVSRTD